MARELRDGLGEDLTFMVDGSMGCKVPRDGRSVLLMLWFNFGSDAWIG